MNHRSKWIDAREVAIIRQLQLQRAISDAAQVRSALNAERARQREIEAAHAAHLEAWRSAAFRESLSPMLLANCSAAVTAIASQRDDAKCRVDKRLAEMETARHTLKQGDSLAASAKQRESQAEKHHRRMLDEYSMIDLEIRIALSGTHP
ncbi:hypothetical protein DF107_31565 [Burkholderia stagnalis]|uniref:hypothetical protein n=1 Tax=Burkholderia stagnalis TaxID=1503054 RepID=UPI000F5AC8BC|nr:hypothetical protein [Burkholderia stagnalis]RQQ07088.1 hypothetical protein DF161_31150 [Burkholderia stagnalis]RQQ94129.1 hypothetical protein DF031_29940 [Burkholderia stagnalis]RQX85864.1 hypothetical protein DF120_31930 [Burkholderia stagnalis]RQY14941.1 hypothetical protein DF117_27890 [Burkholderia stagnalis]RQY75911.1 hypothetical protein DF107_31565 [Burkholderia stagnalis]